MSPNFDSIFVILVFEFEILKADVSALDRENNDSIADIDIELARSDWAKWKVLAKIFVDFFKDSAM